MYILSFSKRFTSPFMGWKFPIAVEVEKSYPGHVGGVKGWVQLDISDEKAIAVAKYASKVVRYASISLLQNGKSIPVRDAWDMMTAKGFSTPQPDIPHNCDDVPIITEDDVKNYILSHSLYLSREECELAVDIGFESIHSCMNGHDIKIVLVSGNRYILPGCSDPNTEKVIRHYWANPCGYQRGQLREGIVLWERVEMEESVDENFIAGYNGKKYQIIPSKYPGVIVAEVFAPSGRYLWFSTEHRFKIAASGMFENDMFFYGEKCLSNGYYSNTLPGDKCVEGWDFAHELYKVLDEEWLDFRVSRPFNCGYADCHVQIRINRNENLNNRVQRIMGFIREEIPQKMWNQETINKIQDIVRS